MTVKPAIVTVKSTRPEKPGSRAFGPKLVFAAMLGAGLLALTNCATAPTETNAGPYPAKYREITREHLRTSLFDPYSARDFHEAPPKIGQVLVAGTVTYETGWVVCYRGNAKNRMGAYTGATEAVLLIRGDRAITSNSKPEHYEIRTYCKDVTYEPLSLN